MSRPARSAVISVWVPVATTVRTTLMVLVPLTPGVRLLAPVEKATTLPSPDTVGS